MLTHHLDLPSNPVNPIWLPSFGSLYGQGLQEGFSWKCLGLQRYILFLTKQIFLSIIFILYKFRKLLTFRRGRQTWLESNYQFAKLELFYRFPLPNIACLKFRKRKITYVRKALLRNRVVEPSCNISEHLLQD